MSDLPSAEWIAAAFDAALAEHDMVGVAHAIRLMAVRDPNKAQLWLNVIDLATAIRADQDVAVVGGDSRD